MEKIVKIWTVFVLVLIGTNIYLYTRYTSQKEYKQVIGTILSDKHNEVEQLSSQIKQKDEVIVQSQQTIKYLDQEKSQLNSHVNNLEGRVAGLTTQRQVAYPFEIPTNGTLGSFEGTFGGNMMGFRHWGVDIWTTTENSGAIASHVGNPVYSACDGVVANLFEANGAILIRCDTIDTSFNVPHRDVYTYYGHMGNADQKNLYFTVGYGTRVRKGQHIGYQGDISEFFPDMRNVHLHFSVFPIHQTSENKGALNPCIYIGGDCHTRGSVFMK